MLAMKFAARFEKGLNFYLSNNSTDTDKNYDAHTNPPQMSPLSAIHHNRHTRR